ncbi:complexed with Cdc5 protein Cwf21 [Schizosaccharomyces osmophilus]|uniref:Complexed with Cdc5 protein Cwf21 n=1 Tax=Schizosaccharomyces osmophilus TaxID=2545709 RepID=A0AAE9WC77_9SCHI|nr:complexed with Cdc5 protein Cwf21 [Schizosaccharomyces osmophilus]WBW73559.1 complexed with Cdc5 protein Cwf21 [Schizosaccharomyces osmophilus]
MSYNGIGLQTPRGSGTNGYVMRNLSNVKRYNNTGTKKMHEYDEKTLTKRRIDPEISKHERRRQIESKVLLFREELLAHTEPQQTRYPEEEDIERKEVEEEERGKRDENIEALVQEYREKLWKESEEEDRYHEKNNFESLMHDDDEVSGSRGRNDYHGHERKNQKYKGRLESRRDISPMSASRGSQNRRHGDSYYRGRDRYVDDVERDYEPDRRSSRSERPKREDYDSYSSYRPRRHARSRSKSRSPSPRNQLDTREERNYHFRRPSFQNRERSPPERGELQESNSPIE